MQPRKSWCPKDTSLGKAKGPPPGFGSANREPVPEHSTQGSVATATSYHECRDSGHPGLRPGLSQVQGSQGDPVLAIPASSGPHFPKLRGSPSLLKDSPAPRAAIPLVPGLHLPPLLVKGPVSSPGPQDGLPVATSLRLQVPCALKPTTFTGSGIRMWTSLGAAIPPNAPVRTPSV